MATATKKPQNETLQTVPAGEGKKKKAKKEKVKRTAWGERNEKGELKAKIKGTNLPEGFDAKVHSPLRRGDFEHPADYLVFTADRLEAKVKRLREEATKERSLGTVTDRKKAKRFAALATKMASMEKELRESGMSDEQIKAIMTPSAK